MEELVLLGDEAVALGALHAGLSAAYGYPGTPSTEIMEYLIAARERPRERPPARSSPIGAPTRRPPTRPPSACPSRASASS
jgi:TPP-dependent indolepyruvate ferredoxin oxidoreductase alpha subunit